MDREGLKGLKGAKIVDARWLTDGRQKRVAIVLEVTRLTNNYSTSTVTIRLGGERKGLEVTR